MKNILCIDFDDCIYPPSILTDKTFWDNSISIKQLDVNIDKVLKLKSVSNFEIFLTTSWSLSYDYCEETKSVSLKNTFKEYMTSDTLAAQFYFEKLNGSIIGISKGDRKEDILDLLDKGYRVVAIDDMDLSDINDDNYKYIGVYGSLNFSDSRTIFNFFKN